MITQITGKRREYSSQENGLQKYFCLIILDWIAYRVRKGVLTLGILEDVIEEIDKVMEIMAKASH